MKGRRSKRIIGRVLKVVSVVGGMYLVIVVFGVGPVKKIGDICMEQEGWRAVIKIALQVLKLLFGATYSFFGMLLLYRWGQHLVDRNQ